MSYKFCRKIQYYRRKRGLTQEQLAEMLGTSTNHLSAIERGIKLPRADTLIRIMNSLQVRPDEIFSDDVELAYTIKKDILSDMIDKLPEKEQDRIFAVIEAMVSFEN